MGAKEDPSRARACATPDAARSSHCPDGKIHLTLGWPTSRLYFPRPRPRPQARRGKGGGAPFSTKRNFDVTSSGPRARGEPQLDVGLILLGALRSTSSFRSAISQEDPAFARMPAGHRRIVTSSSGGPIQPAQSRICLRGLDRGNPPHQPDLLCCGARADALVINSNGRGGGLCLSREGG